MKNGTRVRLEDTRATGTVIGDATTTEGNFKIVELDYGHQGYINESNPNAAYSDKPYIRLIVANIDNLVEIISREEVARLEAETKRIHADAKAIRDLPRQEQIRRERFESACDDGLYAEAERIGRMPRKRR